MKIQPSDLQPVLNEILSDYTDDVKVAVGQSIRTVVKDAVKKLKKAGSFGGNKYRKTWTSKIVEERLATYAVIYNKTAGLTHLLEFGHALYAGGRKVGNVQAFEHIAPINNEVQTEVIEEIKGAINDI